MQCEDRNTLKSNIQNTKDNSYVAADGTIVMDGQPVEVAEPRYQVAA